MAGPAAAADRLRAGLPGGGPGAAGLHSEARWLRFARAHLAGMFPYLPQRPGYNKRLRAALPLVKRVIRQLAADTDSGSTTCGSPTPPRCSAACRARPCNARTWPAGPATATAPPTPASSGACGCTWSAPRPGCRSCGRWPTRRSTNARCWPRCWTSSRPGRRPGRPAAHRRQGLRRPPSSKPDLAERGIELLRPSLATREAHDPASRCSRPVRQLIESVNDTLKGQLDLEHHGGRTFEGVAVRVAQRILAMAAAIWHNHNTGAPITRSLIAYDH